ncbi:MAG TPA: twin-arginine translocase subunit TatC [Candidatus Limnocylindrales bacterium]
MADVAQDAFGGRRPEAAPPSAPAPGTADDVKVMSLVEHLTELRRRIFISILAVVLGSVVGFIAAPQIIHILREPLPSKDPLVALGLGDAFFINLKVALVVGVILAMPVWLYEVWAFISPGLTREERRVARPWVPLALVFFAIGVGLAYFILPYASAFLFGFQSPDLKIFLAADRYFDFVTTLFLAFGLVMEFPMILVLLSKVGIVTSKRLTSSRRMVILGITIFSALITPGGDLVSPVAMAVTMYVLFELSIILVRAGGR